MIIKICDHHVLPRGLGVYKLVLSLPGEDNSSMACIQSGAKYVLLNVKSPNSCLDLSEGDNHSSTSPTVSVYHCARLTKIVIGFPPHDGPNQQVIDVFMLDYNVPIQPYSGSSFGWTMATITLNPHLDYTWGLTVHQKMTPGLLLGRSRTNGMLKTLRVHLARSGEYYVLVHGGIHFTFHPTCRIYVAGLYTNIDLSDYGNPSPGTPVTLWDQWEPGLNQLWLLQKVWGWGKQREPTANDPICTIWILICYAE